MVPAPKAPSPLAPPRISPETAERAGRDRPWQVVVHNDPVNLMSYVTLVLQRIFGYPREEAERLMLQIHETGRSIVWSGHREKAELYVQQLHAHLLSAVLQQSGQ